MSGSQVDNWTDHLDQKIAERHMLKHPFYRGWTEGTLSTEALRQYVGQYYRHEAAFPVYLAGIYVRCADDQQARRAVLDNLIDEDKGEENHSELWLRFGEALGLERAKILCAAPLPETLQALESYHGLCVDGSAIQGVAAVYAYESMIPEVSAVKVAGLKKHYGISGPRDLAFFTLHEELDVQHRQWNRDLLLRFVKTDADVAEAIAAGEEAAEALWTLLDGVQREYVN